MYAQTFDLYDSYQHMCWTTCVAILGSMRPRDCRLDIPAAAFIIFSPPLLSFPVSLLPLVPLFFRNTDPTCFYYFKINF